MAENSATETADNAPATSAEGEAATPAAQPLQMSFADWKKCKEALVKPESNTDGNAGEQRNGRRQQKHIKPPACGEQKQQQQQQLSRSRGVLHRPPPLPLPLMSLNFPNYGHCGPPPPMPPPCAMGMGMGPPPRRGPHRQLPPPPFWEDLMSPQHRPPPIQPPMPKCPSLWNLVPKDKSNRKANTANKKHKTNNAKAINESTLMPPPSLPGDAPVQLNGAQPAAKKAKKKGGPFVQVDGQWIQKPEAPLPLDECAPGTKEDRQRQWKEYRQAMKPFKNREFHNWKRTVQRLSKLPRETLDEKQLDRLQKAEEYIGAHKAMLTMKHAERWVPQENETSSPVSQPAQAQVFVRKPISTFWDKKSDELNPFRRTAKKYVGTGRAIKGGGMDSTPMGHFPSAPPPISSTQQARENARPSGMASGYFGQDYDSRAYGQESHSGSSYYSGYSSHFIKGDTLLPP